MTQLNIWLDALGAQNCDPQKSASGYQAKCPAHEDKTPSLSVWENDDGTVGCKCYAGCEWQAVKKSLGLWTEAKQGGKSGAQELPSGPDTRHWIYTDADGLPFLAVVRKDSGGRKRITQWRPAGDGEWLPEAPQGQRPLLGLPDLAKTDNRILIVEGEKCFDSVRKHWPGQPVTTWAGGTNTVGKTDWQPLAGKKVLLIADGDVPGRKAMREIGDLLLDLDCDVELVATPGSGKDDIADWLADTQVDAKAKVDGLRKPYTEKQTKTRVSAKQKGLQDAGAKELAKGVSTDTFADIAQELGLSYRFDNLRDAQQWRLDEALGPLPATADFEEWDHVRAACLLETIRARFFTIDSQGRTHWINFGGPLGEQAILGAMQSSRFNPFEEYLKSCKERPGSPALAECLEPWSIDSNDELGSWVATALWQGVVQRALSPGCQIRTSPLLIGQTGVGKSSYLREMLPPHLIRYFNDSFSLGMNEQQRVEATHRCIISEWQELKGLKRSTESDAKAHLTTTVDTARPAYARPQERPRQYFQIGTLNDSESIPGDAALAARFAAVTMTKGPDQVPYLAEWRESFWAQAYALYLDDPKAICRMPTHLEAQQEQATAPFITSIDELEEAYTRLIDKADMTPALAHKMASGVLNGTALGKEAGLLSEEDKGLGQYVHSWGRLLVNKGAVKKHGRRGTCYQFPGFRA